MIFPLAGLLIGAVIGGLRARARQGKGADIAQWAAVHAMIFGIIGLFILILVDRSMV